MMLRPVFSVGIRRSFRSSSLCKNASANHHHASSSYRRNSNQASSNVPLRGSRKWLLLLGGTVAVIALGWAAKSAYQHFQGGIDKSKKKKVVILGSGWAALQVVREIDTDLFDVTVVSPRNYFLFTPLLASASVGTVEFLSVVEPLRKFCQRSNAEITYYQAVCTDVFHENNQIRCEETSGVPSAVKSFDLNYDYLVVAVGATTSCMGVTGVQDNCYFLKDITDSKKIRQRIMDCLEAASYPTQSAEERKRLLHFVVVGGGPTGVEFSAELHDFIKTDIPRYFPSLAPLIQITLVQSADHILNTYDKSISTYAEKEFSREHIQVITNARVVEVSPTDITLVDKAKNSKDNIPFGMCVWAAGIGPNPLTTKIADSIPEQNHSKALITDEFCRVKGIKSNNVYAVGDCLTLTQRKMMDKLVELFTAADEDRDGGLSHAELKHLFRRVVPEFPHVGPFAHGIKRLIETFDTNHDGILQLEEFQHLLAEIDTNLKSVPTTAQAASQAGHYVANSLNEVGRNGDQAVLHPFVYKHLGSFAYIGGNEAVLDSQAYTGGGFGVWWLWRATYFSKQLSWRNRLSLAFDWMKTMVNGRDISKV